MKQCNVCGKKIPKKRLKVLPTTDTCVKCSQIQEYKGITVWDKTTSILEVVNEEDMEKFKKLENGEGRFSRF